MADDFPSITDEQARLITDAKVFFVASADPSMGDGPGGIGPVNLSPKGGTPLHIIDRNRVAYLDYVGSGDETARHARAGGPVTVMVCSFEEADAGAIRLYGKATITPVGESPLTGLLHESPAADIALPERQVIDIQIDRTSTSCGYGVPIFAFEKQRTVGQRGRRYKPKK
jgi:hypothetical protein